MLINRPQVHIISREVTMPGGEIARAFFAIREVNGVLDVKFLGIKPIEAHETSPVLLLDSPRVTIWQDVPLVSVFEKLSPFFTLEFLTSQLARAPSKKV